MALNKTSTRGLSARGSRKLDLAGRRHTLSESLESPAVSVIISIAKDVSVWARGDVERFADTAAFTVYHLNRTGIGHIVLCANYRCSHRSDREQRGYTLFPEVITSAVGEVHPPQPYRQPYRADAYLQA